MKQKEYIKFFILINIVFIAVGCGGYGKYHYYSPYSESGTPKRKSPISFTIVHYKDKEGPNERIEVKLRDIDMEIYSHDDCGNIYYMSFLVPFPMIPVFGDPCKSYKLSSDGLSISLEITRLEKDLEIQLSKINVRADGSHIPSSLNKHNEQYGKGDIIKVQAASSVDQIINLDFPTTREYGEFILDLEGFFLEGEQLKIAEVTFRRTSEMVYFGD